MNCKRGCLVVLLFIGNAFCAADRNSREPWTIVQNNQSDYCIIVRKEAPQSTQLAAKELQLFIAKTAEVTLPIHNDFTGQTKGIFIGENEALPKEKRFFSSSYADEAYAVYSWEESIVIMGGEPAGSRTFDNYGLLYGVYDFIERFLGTRWYAPGELGECVERKASIVITGLPIEHKPPYFCRTLWPEMTEESNSSEEFRIWFRRLRGNGGKEFNPNHSMDAFSQEHLDTPEIFALDANGKRIFGVCEVRADGEKRQYKWSQYPQFCYSSGKLVELYVKAIDGWYHGGPEAARNTFFFTPHDENFIYLVPPDNSGLNPCHCPDCVRTNAQPNGPSNLIWAFVSEVAEAVKEKYPTKKLATLAYNEYVMPPDENIKIPDNVVVRICVRPPIIYFGSDTAKNKSCGIIDAWSKRVSNVSVWQYHTNFGGNAIYPVDIPHVIHDFYLHYSSKMDSALLEARDQFSPSKSAYIIGDFPRELLNLHFSMKSLWNPHYDVNAELERFYTLFFGPAAKPMKSYFEVITGRWEKWPASTADDKGGNSVAGNPSGALIYKQIYPLTIARELDNYIKSAQQQTAEGSIYRRRVEWYIKELHEPFYKLSEAYSKEIRKELAIYDAESAPVVDGDMNDIAWETAERIPLFSSSGPVAPVYPSFFQMVVKNGILYIAVKAQDPHFNDQTLNAKERDGEVFTDDSIELFISPDAEHKSSYYQMAINLNGVVYDAKHGNGKWDTGWNADISVAVAKLSGLWQMEIAIRLKELGISKLDFGKKLGFNLCRNKNSGLGECREASQWIPTAGNYNTPGLFGELVYSKDSSPRKVQ